MSKIEKLYFDAELPLPEDKEERVNEYVIFKAGQKSRDEEIKKLREALEDSEETLKYVLQYFEGKAMSAEDDIKYSLKLITEALKEIT